MLCLSFFPFSSILPHMDESEIKSIIPILDENGIPLKDKWARHPYFAYSRKNLRCFPLSIWQWNECTVFNKCRGYAVNIFFSDFGSCGFFSIAYIDFRKGAGIQESRKYFTLYRTGLKDSSCENESASYLDKDNKMTLSIIKKGMNRHIIFNAPDMELADGNRGLLGDFSISQSLDKESLCTITGWPEMERKFRLYEIIPALKPCSGFIRKNGKKDYLAEDNALAVIEWQRGIWCRHNDIMQAFASSYSKTGTISFVFGSDTHSNAFFIDDRLYKLGSVSAEGNMIRDDKGAVSLHFTPLAALERKNRGPGFSISRKQDYGLFDGYVIIEGKRIDIPEAAGTMGRLITS